MAQAHELSTSLLRVTMNAVRVKYVKSPHTQVRIVITAHGKLLFLRPMQAKIRRGIETISA